MKTEYCCCNIKMDDSRDLEVPFQENILDNCRVSLDKPVK